MKNGDAERSLSGADLIIALLIGVAALALRVPFRSRLAYYWDGAQFALAIGEYDLTRSQPHAPGYFLYVMLGRNVNSFVSDPHASLVWISVAAGSALAALGYLLGVAMFGRGCGLATGAILVTSPLCWFHSEVALTNIVDAALVTSTILFCWMAIAGGGSWTSVVVLSVLMAAVAGVRQQTGPVLLPAWAYTLCRLSVPRLRKQTVAVSLTGGLCLMWLILTVQRSRGIRTYVQLLLAKARFDAQISPWGGGLSVLRNNMAIIVDACWAGLLGTSVVAAWEFLRWVFLEDRETKRIFYAIHREQLRLLAIWILPMAAFSTGTCVTLPAYVMSFFPGLAILAGAAISRCAERCGQVGKLHALAVVCGMIVALDCVAFLAGSPWANRLLLGLPLGAPQIRTQEQQLGETLGLIRAKYKPDDVLICHHLQYYRFSLRHFQYHLPEYRNVLLTPDTSLPAPWNGKLWLGYGRRTEFLDKLEKSSVPIVLLVVPPGEGLGIFKRHCEVGQAQLVPGSNGTLYSLPATLLRP